MRLWPGLHFSMNGRDRTRLRHMLDAANEAISFVVGKNSGDLYRDRLLALALAKEIEIIGEAASKISTECRTALAEVPWSTVIGIRNRLIHAYFDVDLNIVWSTTTCDLPDLVRELEKALSSPE